MPTPDERTPEGRTPEGRTPEGRTPEEQTPEEQTPEAEPEAEPEEQPLHAVAERMERAAEGDTATVGEVLDGAAGRAFGPLLLVPALLALLPVIGAIPGMSIATGALLILIAGQVLVGRTQPWVPERLRRISFRRKALNVGLEKAMPALDRIDAVLRRRLPWVTDGPGRYVTMLCILAMSVLMFPLAFVPFGVTPPAAAIFVLALGITAGDGVWVAAGWAATVVATAAGIWLLLGL